MRRFLIGMIIIAVGVMMLLRRMGVANFDWFFEFDWHLYFFPILIIFVGLMILLGGRGHHSSNSASKDICPDMKMGDCFKASCVWSASKYNFAGQPFSGAKIDAFMGGATIDLRGANITDNCVIKVSAFMGGVDILADANTTFVVQSSCVMGGVDNKHVQSSTLDAKHVILKAECFMGGVDIK